MIQADGNTTKANIDSLDRWRVIIHDQPFQKSHTVTWQIVVDIHYIYLAKKLAYAGTSMASR